MAPSDATKTESKTHPGIRVTMTKDRLSAMVIIKAPDESEPDITPEELAQALTDAGVVNGINQDLLVTSLFEKQYDTPITIAKGVPAQKGLDTAFEYLFETEHKCQPQEDEDGRINYRDMNYIQNTTKDTVLVRATPPTEGVPGKGVDGKEIAAPRGRKIPLEVGDGTVISEDGSELLAKVDGAILFSHGKVSVRDVMVIKGDLDYSVGNIDAVGSVKITGKVFTGFTLNVGGDLEISDNVEDCTINCKGNILVRGGFFGSGEGIMHADGDITLKHAQGQKITSGGTITVGGELINCHVTAKENVLVKGKKGKIVGGEINAGKQIRASVIGSEAGTATVLTVAYDAKLMREYHEAVHEKQRLEADQERVKESLTSLYRLQLDGKLTPQQTQVLQKLDDFNKGVPQAVERLEQKMTELEEKMKELRDAKIIVEGTLYAGVKAHIGVLAREIEEDVKACLLTGDGSRVEMSRFDSREHDA